LPISVEAGTQSLQTVKAIAEGIIAFLANMISVTLGIRESLGRLCCLPAFHGDLLDAREGLAVPIQFFRHPGHDNSQKIHGFTECCDEEGRGYGTGLRHCDFRDQG